MSQYKILIFAANAKKRHKMPLPFIDFAPLIPSRYSKPPFELLSYAYGTHSHTHLELAPLSHKILKSFLRPNPRFYHLPVKTKKVRQVVPLYIQHALSFSVSFVTNNAPILAFIDALLTIYPPH